MTTQGTTVPLEGLPTVVLQFEDGSETRVPFLGLEITTDQGFAVDLVNAAGKVSGVSLVGLVGMRIEWPREEV